VFVIIGSALLLRELRDVVVQLLIAILLAAAATPIVDRATAPRWPWSPPRALAAIVVFVAALVLFLLGSVVIVATVSHDLIGLATTLPVYATQVQRAIDEFVGRNPELAALLGAILPETSDILRGAIQLVQASRVLGLASGVFGTALYVVFTFVLALYLTIDGDRVRRYAIEFLPSERRGQALLITERIGLRLGAWARGEALLAAIVGGMTWIGALLIGLPYAAALALVAAVGELVPNLGPIVAAVPLIAFGLLSSPTQAALALLLAVVVQQLENNLIVPRVMGRAVNLHPVVVMLAILSGAELLGIPGALMAVPVAAAASVVITELKHERVSQPVGDEDSSLRRGSPFTAHSPKATPASAKTVHAHH
jgi:predicted PurR-regulated permease PerM